MALVATPSDTALSRAVAAGDRDALGAIYDQYGEQLLDFCHSLLHDAGAAQDCLRDVFVTVWTRVGELHDPTMLRAWLFAVARHECRARLDAHDALYASAAELFVATEPLPSVAGPEVADTVDIGAVVDATATIELPVLAAQPEVTAVSEPLPDLGPLLDEVDDGLPYDEHLLLELADRHGLAEVEVAAAIGVPRPAAPGLIERARRSARAAGVVALGEGHAFAAEAVSLRGGILAAADLASAGLPATTSPDEGAGAPVAGAGWNGAWPPSDPAFATVQPRRRWGAPLAVLAVLLLALVAIAGLLALTGGSGHRSVAQPLTVPLASTSAGAGGSGATAGTPSAAVTTEAVQPPIAAPPAGSVAVQPPTPSLPASNSAGSGTWVIFLSTDQHAVVVSSGHAQASCGAGTTCTFTVANGAQVRIADTSSGRGATFAAPDTFSAPPSCTKQKGSCTFAVTSNLQIVLTTPGLLNQRG